jgi:hypothetical protein
MSRPDLTAEWVRGLFDYDHEMGALIWRVDKGPRARRGDVAGSTHSSRRGYVKVDGRSHLVHRLIWLHVYGRWPEQEIDHVDGDPLNNRIANLRDVTRSVNQQNLFRAKANNQCGLLGVRRVRGRWRARITSNGSPLHIGSFATAEEAHQAYLKAKRELHPGCTI